MDVAGCPPLVALLNKTGWLFLYNRSNLSAGPLQSLRMGPGSGAGSFHGMLAWDPVLQILFMDNPQASTDGTFVHGAVAMMVSPSTCTLQTAWQSAFTVVAAEANATPPTIAGGLVWMTTGKANSAVAYNEVGGDVAWTSGALKGPVNVPVTVADGQVFIQAGPFLYAWGL